jgi:phosphoglycolate phosphatase-like HAD superfamily hydrolase
MNGEISFAGRSDRAIANDLFVAHRLEPSAENWDRFRRGYTERLGESLAANEGRVLPGVVELLDVLANRDDVLVGLLTGNLRVTAQRKLTHYGLWGRFPFGGFGDEHLDRDDIATMAMAEAKAHHGGGGPPAEIDGEVIVLGDTLHDIRCARSIGARVVAVPTGQTPSDVLRGGEPDLLVETLGEVGPILELLRRSA